MPRTAYLLLAAFSVFLLAGHTTAPEPNEFAGFVEPDFPFITTTVDAGDLAPALPARNVAIRGIAMQLGNDTYAVFDPDLLRMAVGWHGDFLELNTMAPISYNMAGNKKNGIPRVLGTPIFGTGVYPGWLPAGAAFEDPRPAGPNPEEVGRGPIPEAMGRWNGLYTAGGNVVLAYTVQGTDIYEQPGSRIVDGAVGVTRTFRSGPVHRALTLVAAEVGNGSSAENHGDWAVVYQGPDRATATAIGVVDAPADARLDVVEDRFITLTLPEGTPASTFKVVAWSGAPDSLDAFRRMLTGPVEMVDFQQGGPSRWPEAVTTRGEVSNDTAALVLDELTLPLPNPWRRNVRVAGIDFFSDGRAALSTFDGDVWILSGIDEDLRNLRWKRFASGLYEPLTLKIVDDEIYTFGRDGIIRLNDLNDDGEADYYENFSNLAIQTIESREYPLSMGVGPDGSFYLSKGAATNNGPKTSPPVMPGFRAGSEHSGTILRVAPDGRSIEVFATGLREPYVSVDPKTGIVTSSDQQGNFVPSTPLFHVQRGDFFGVPATAHGADPTDPVPPLLWIPHQVDQSGTTQVWVHSERMGPLNGSLVHLSYGEPAAFRVYVDSTRQPWQGAIIELPVPFTTPAMQGAVNPADGKVYIAGFQVWDSKAARISGLMRLRPTGTPSLLPADVRAGSEGILLRFDEPLDPATATQPAHYVAERWNYQRSEKYGSGHYKPDGSPGREALPIAAAQLSEDGKAVLLHVPDMAEVMQMSIQYDLDAASGQPIQNAVYLTVNRLDPLDLEANGFDPDEAAVLAATPIATNGDVTVAASPERGRALYLQMGCMACHSTDGTLKGKSGPTFKGAFGTMRTFNDGTTIHTDAAYFRRSILEPAAQVVKGYPEEMPSYLGVLSDADVESIVLFIKSLSKG